MLKLNLLKMTNEDLAVNVLKKLNMADDFHMLE